MILDSYWWLLIWAIVGVFCCDVIVPKKSETLCGEVVQRWYVIPALLAVLPLILWAAFRSDYFGDTAVYRANIENIARYGSLREYMGLLTKDKWFYATEFVAIKYIKHDATLIFGMFAAFQLIVLALVYRKYSCDYWLSIFVFVASTDYLSWCWNGVRQFTAVTIVLLATKFIIEKKYIIAVLLVLIASQFHQSALLMLPIIFIVQGRAWNIRTIICIIAAVIALVFVNRFTSLLEKLLSETQYTNVISDYKAWQDDGTSPLRVLVYAMPMILSIFGHNQIREANNTVVNVCVNASIITTALYLISMGTSGIFMGRLPIYVSLLATGILLPWEVNNVFAPNSVPYIKATVVILYAIFFWFQMNSWGVL